MGVVRNQREVPLELDNAGQLAALVPGAADGFGGGLIDGKHAVSLGVGGRAGQVLIPGLDYVLRHDAGPLGPGQRDPLRRGRADRRRPHVAVDTNPEDDVGCSVSGATAHGRRLGADLDLGSDHQLR